MPYMDDEQDDQQQDYQDVGGFRVRVPSRARYPMDEAGPLPGGGDFQPKGGSDTSGQFSVKNTAESTQPQANASPRPSFGSRISASADGTPPLTVHGDQNRKPLDAIASSIKNQLPPTPPSPQQTMGPLLQKRAQLGVPTDRKAVDPETGKPKYRMGIGTRIAGSIANFASGFNGRGPVSYVGPGATNQQYSIDEASRKANLENVDTQIGQQKELGDENRKLFESANKQAYESQIGAARQEAAEAQQSASAARNALATEKTRHDQAEEQRKSEEDKNTVDPHARPSLQKNPATGKMELMVKTKGGGMVPYTPKTAEEGALLGDPNARAMFNYMHRKGGGKDEDNPELNGLSAAEQRDFKNRTKLSDKKIDSLMGARRDAVLFKQDTKDIDKQLADSQAERDQIRDDILSHRKGGKLQSEAQQRQNTNPQTGRKVGDVVTVKGQRIKVTKILPGGKYEGVPAN